MNVADRCTDIRYRARIFWQGVLDGLEEPWDLSVGMTADPRLNEFYDRGANLGQRLGRTLALWKDGPTAPIKET